MLNNIKRFTTTASGQFIAAPSAGNNNGTATASPRARSLNSYNYQTTADMAGFGSGGGFSVGYSATGKQVFVGMLDGFLPEDTKIRNNIYRDIYRHDSVAGGAVDIYATMPFSDFYLTGLKDKEALNVYHRSIEAMRMKIMFPAITRDYLIYGRFIGTTVFSTQENIFSAIMPQDSNRVDLQPVPIYGMDPLINLTLPDSLRKLLANRKDPRVVAILDSLPDHIKNNLALKTIPLDPATTLFIPRRTETGDNIGTSFFERILPIHIMEKAMIRGSINQVQRRQRAILHITVTGDGDNFIPTIQNLEAVRNLFAEADADPTGAIVVTHSGVQPNEIRDASQFFRADELFEYFNSSKYKALNVSEAMVTGEANFNAMDATLSLFIENLREFRSMLTREVFYEKIFPAIAVANDFYRDRYHVTSSSNYGFSSLARSGIMENNTELFALCAGTRHGFNIKNYGYDTSELAMPIVSWQKHLRPEGDQNFLNLLAEAEQHQVPIPIAMFASAAGVDINAILNGQDQEIALRKRLKQYNDKLAEFSPNNQEDGGDGQYNAQASLQALASSISNKPKNWLTREYDERLLPHERKKSGTIKNTSAKRRKQLYQKQLQTLADVLKHRAETDRREARYSGKPR